MQVGNKVWIFDSNRRKYEDDKGNKLDRCWYRYHFTEKYIIGETTQSWIVGYKNNSVDDRSNYKVNKKTLNYSTTNLVAHDGKLYISEEEINEKCWLNDNKGNIRERVSRCSDYEKLKKIEEILNS
jgi:hypothetical protein